MDELPVHTIIHAAAVFDPETRTAGPLSLALKGRRIYTCGQRHTVDDLRGPDTEIIEINDGLVVPGFHDFHIHLFAGSLTAESVDLHSARSEEEAAAMVGDFALKHPEDEWVFGFNWYHVFWEKPELPRKQTLDRYIPERPVFLFNAEYHGVWVNSKALEVCGIDAGTPDPPFGKIERNEAGEPTGFLYETAIGLAGKTALDLPEEKTDRLFRSFMSRAAAAGVTSVHDMLPLPGMLCGDPALYARYEAQGRLGVRIFLEGDLAGSLDRARELRRRYTSPMLSFSGLKQFVDGVATTYTAYLVDPYSDRPDTQGGTLIPPDRLAEWVVAADADQFRIRLHACGDGAVRTALDCYETALRRNGCRDSRHTIEHIETIHPADYSRLADLGVTASIQPEHLAMTERFEDSPYIARLGRGREKYLWPDRTLIRWGIPVCYGSDFPIVDLDPLKGLYRAVTRVHDDGNPPGGWIPEERVSMGRALACYTLAGARGSFMEDSLGRLSPGCYADIAVLDRNILKCEVEELREVRNILTISNGTVVFRDMPG